MLGAHAAALFRLAVSEHDVRNLIPPTLLLHGSRSFPFEAVLAARFCHLRPATEQIRIEGAGHTLHLQRADAVNAALKTFLLA